MTKASKKRANARKLALKKKQSAESTKDSLSTKTDTYVKPSESGTKSPPTDTQMSQDPNTYDRPPDLNDNGGSVMRNPYLQDGDISVRSDNSRHSDTRETFKSVLNKSIHDTVTEKPPTNTFHLLKMFL